MQTIQAIGRPTAVPRPQQALGSSGAIAGQPLAQHSGLAPARRAAKQQRLAIAATAAPSGFSGYGPQGGECGRAWQGAMWPGRAPPMLNPRHLAHPPPQATPASRSSAAAVVAATPSTA